MLSRFNQFNRTRKQKDHRSKLEDEVEQALISQGLSPKYEPDKFEYTLHRKYTPDFLLGLDVNGNKVFSEIKGWWPSSERMKFLSVIRNNPELRIFVALQRPNQRLSKQSKTTLAQWCQKQGINWSPIPIPPDFIDQWLNGTRCTCRVQDAKAATRQRSTKTAPSSASAAKDDLTPKQGSLGLENLEKSA